MRRGGQFPNVLELGVGCAPAALFADTAVVQETTADEPGHHPATCEFLERDENATVPLDDSCGCATGGGLRELLVLDYDLPPFVDGEIADLDVRACSAFTFTCNDGNLCKGHISPWIACAALTLLIIQCKIEYY